MKYTFVRLSDDGAGGTLPEFTVVAQVDSGSPGPDYPLAQKLDTEIFRLVSDLITASVPIEGQPASVARGGAPRGRPGQLVQVIAIADPVNVPSGVALNETYGTSELSTLLGYTYNAVVQAVSIARCQRAKDMAEAKDPVEKLNISSYPPQAVKRGVTFCYVNDLSTGNL